MTKQKPPSCYCCEGIEREKNGWTHHNFSFWFTVCPNHCIESLRLNGPICINFADVHEKCKTVTAIWFMSDDRERHFLWKLPPNSDNRKVEIAIERTVPVWREISQDLWCEYINLLYPSIFEIVIFPKYSEEKKAQKPDHRFALFFSFTILR